jgi:hypothetical protein
LLQAGSGRQAYLYPCSRHIFGEREFLEKSQRNITSSLLDTLCHVPAFQKNGLPPVAQIHRLSNTVSTVVVLPFDISHVADVFGRKQEQPAKHQQSRRGSAAVLTSSPYKNTFEED